MFHFASLFISHHFRSIKAKPKQYSYVNCNDLYILTFIGRSIKEESFSRRFSTMNCVTEMDVVLKTTLETLLSSQIGNQSGMDEQAL